MKRIPHRELIDREREPHTPGQLADQFAARAVRDILTPAPDGLQVFEELALGTRPHLPASASETAAHSKAVLGEMIARAGKLGR